MPASKKKKTITSEHIREKLKLKHLKESARFSEKYPHAKKKLEEKGLTIGKLRHHSAKLLGAGTVAGTLFLTTPDINMLPTPSEALNTIRHIQGSTINQDAIQMTEIPQLLDKVLPKRVRPLTHSEEKFLELMFRDAYQVNARAGLEGEHLNTTYGIIGAEQHLKRFPGDTVSQHGQGAILNEGIAPGLGAWGYFANSRSEMTPQLEETEKWYAVVQTLYLPDWNTRTRYLREWYKYRKVLIVNTENGQAVVAAIADSGPAAWTGKHFGGSPEVMNALGGIKYKKGAVIVFFVDDPDNKVKLGPVDPHTISYIP